MDPQQVIHQVFDFATIVLNAERDLARARGHETAAAESLKSSG